MTLDPIPMDDYTRRHVLLVSQERDAAFAEVERLRAELRELRAVGTQLASAVRGLDSYAALGGAPMERSERADRALAGWERLRS